MKLKLLIMLPLFICATCFSQETTLKDNKETIEWIKNKIISYCQNKMRGCMGEGNFCIYDSSDEYIEYAWFSGYEEKLEDCIFMTEKKVYYKDIISYSHLEYSNCFTLFTYSSGTYEITFPFVEPEMDLFKRMENALNHLIVQNKILHPIQKEKY